jgi:hypothetical protein
MITVPSIGMSIQSMMVLLLYNSCTIPTRLVDAAEGIRRRITRTRRNDSIRFLWRKMYRNSNFFDVVMEDVSYGNDGNRHHTNESHHQDTDSCNFNFLALGVRQTEDNCLNVYANSYQPLSDHALLKYIVLALETEQDLDDILYVMKEVRACLSTFITPDFCLTSATEALEYCVHRFVITRMVPMQHGPI